MLYMLSNNNNNNNTIAVAVVEEEEEIIHINFTTRKRKRSSVIFFAYIPKRFHCRDSDGECKLPSRMFIIIVRRRNSSFTFLLTVA